MPSHCFQLYFTQCFFFPFYGDFSFASLLLLPFYCYLVWSCGFLSIKYLLICTRDRYFCINSAHSSPSYLPLNNFCTCLSTALISKSAFFFFKNFCQTRILARKQNVDAVSSNPCCYGNFVRVCFYVFLLWLIPCSLFRRFTPPDCKYLQRVAASLSRLYFPVHDRVSVHTSPFYTFNFLPRFNQLFRSFPRGL